jgi:hypothetical protein
VETAAADMHSGMKGGSVQNANHALIQLLSGLWDRPKQVSYWARVEAEPSYCSSKPFSLAFWLTWARSRVTFVAASEWHGCCDHSSSCCCKLIAAGFSETG